jgi:hypothetical protein
MENWHWSCVERLAWDDGPDAAKKTGASKKKRPGPDQAIGRRREAPPWAPSSGETIGQSVGPPTGLRGPEKSNHVVSVREGAGG